MDNRTVLHLENITKSFFGNVVLNNVSFDIKEGEILALLGENGAGKSTLLNIISGSLKMDTGEIFLRNELVQMRNPLAAKKAGIVKVHQELQVVPELTVAENVFLGSELRHPVTKVVWFKKMREEADKLLGQLNADFKSSDFVKELSTAQKQLVEIAKALLLDFSVLILDEPTSSLTNREIEKLFGVMRMLRDQGKSILFVSHRLDEVFEIADRITVLRDGNYIGTMDAVKASHNELIQMMTGRDLSGIMENKSSYKEEVVLSVQNLTSFEGKFKEISFELHRGEILGIAGLVGAGRTEIVRAIFGADRIETGEICIHGKRVQMKSPKDSMAQGLAFIPEDRKQQGMIGILSNKDNVNLCSYDKLLRKQLLFHKTECENSQKYMEMMNVHPLDLYMNTASLSGGNQQKVIIAKWISINADIIIMDEPTRGIDVGAKNEIYRLMLSLTEQGKSIIMVSSDLPEVVNMSNRILVIHEGRINGEIRHEDATETRILHCAMGGK